MKQELKLDVNCDKPYSAVVDIIQPSEDCISRQSVINAIANTCFWLSADNWEELTKCINSISPVTPTRKKGKWIKGSIEQGALGMRYTEKTCSKCGWSHSLIIPQNYCPNCGAEMECE